MRTPTLQLEGAVDIPLAEIVTRLNARPEPPPLVPQSLWDTSIQTALQTMDANELFGRSRLHDLGYGQAVIFDRKSGVKFGASDPRHDGEAVPVPAPYFAPAR